MLHVNHFNSMSVTEFLTQANRYGKKLYVMDARPKINAYANIVCCMLFKCVLLVYTCVLYSTYILATNTHNVLHMILYTCITIHPYYTHMLWKHGQLLG